MLLTGRERQGLERGELRQLFRWWRAERARPGRVHRLSPALALAIDAVEEVTPGALDALEARAAGYVDAETLLADLERHRPAHAGYRLFRIRVRVVPAPAQPARPLPDVLARLAAMDRDAGVPWTAAALRLIGERPRVVSTDLAAELGVERFAFKARVRRLKSLGLTESFEVGYALTRAGNEVLGVLGKGDLP